MVDIQTDAGKQWFSEFQSSENRMRDRIIAIESEIRQTVTDEIAVAVAVVVKIQGYIDTYLNLPELNDEQKADLQTDLQTLVVDLASLNTVLAKAQG